MLNSVMSIALADIKWLALSKMIYCGVTDRVIQVFKTGILSTFNAPPCIL